MLLKCCCLDVKVFPLATSQLFLTEGFRPQSCVLMLPNVVFFHGRDKVYPYVCKVGSDKGGRHLQSYRCELLELLIELAVVDIRKGAEF